MMYIHRSILLLLHYILVTSRSVILDKDSDPSEVGVESNVASLPRPNPGNEIFIITRNSCQFSHLMRLVLTRDKVPYEDYNIHEPGHHDIRKELNRETATFPLVFVNRKYIGGYEESKTNPELLVVMRKYKTPRDFKILMNKL